MVHVELSEALHLSETRALEGVGQDEVHVDAVTGEVVSIEKETPADQKKDKKEDAKKKGSRQGKDDKGQVK